MGTGSRLRSLTGLRAAAAFAVFATHLPQGTAHGAWYHMTIQGNAGVTFFFILSGFVMAWGDQMRDGTKRFYWRRFARIYPAYLVALIIGLLMAPAALSPSNSLSHFLPTAVLAQSWIPKSTYYFAINGPAWTLSVEALFYAVFPILIPWAISGRTVRERRLLLGALVAVQLVLGVAMTLDSSPTATWLVAVSPPLHLGVFLIGSLLAVEVRQGTWPRLNWPLILALNVAVYVVSGFTGAGIYLIALPLIPYMLLIGAAAQRDIAGDGTWFSRRTLVWAGTISYSFYLVHLLVIRGLETSHGPAFSPVWKLIALALAVLAASALYYVVERPADRWLRGVRFSRSRVEPRFEAAG